MKSFCRRVAALSFLLLTACASEQTWYKRGSTEVEFNRMDARCRMMGAYLPQQPASTLGGVGGALADAGASLGAAGASVQFYENCMRSDGWYTAR